MIRRFVTDLLATLASPANAAAVPASQSNNDSALPSGADATPLATDARSADRWTSRARPTFLYVIYALLLWSIPMGLLAGIDPPLGHAIARGMSEYLAGLPEPLYALFATGYLGYTVARQWGKANGTDR